MLSKPVLPLLIAALIATPLAEFSDRRGFEELTARAAIADQASALGTKCPLSKEYIDTAEIGLLSICLKYGLGQRFLISNHIKRPRRVCRTRCGRLGSG
jgi:hypothetical protein